MRFLAALGLLCFLAAGSRAMAQLQVSAQLDRNRTDFLLYERVDLLVTVMNNSESDLVLDNEDGHPWLSFVVAKQNHVPVRPERQAFFKALKLKMGESQTLRINLTPLFSFREVGGYTATAVINLPGAGNFATSEVPFTVLQGRQVWSETRPVAGSDHVYSLVRFSPKPDETELYLRVEDPNQNVVYSNVGLGPIEAYVDPEVFFDPQGNIHVLHIISASHYLYTRADPQGKVIHQGVFRTMEEIPPRLAKMEDGSIYVAGGMEQTPDMVREPLSDGQRNSHASKTSRPAPPVDADAPPARAGANPGALPLPAAATSTKVSN